VKWLVVLAGLAPAAGLQAQEGQVPLFGDLWNTLRAPERAGWVRPLASALAPGTGQFLGGDARGAIYLVVDAVLLVRVLRFRAQAGREGDRFRDLAFVVARGAYGPTARDTTFEYFEQMGRFIESGPFDSDPGPAFVPPEDASSYNGAIWLLARETFFPDPAAPPDPESPEYQRAIAFYASRAIGPNFRWSWRNAGLEQDLFRQTIRDSDEAFRAASQQLGLLLANHVLSAVDAFITHRLSTPDRSVRVESTVLAPPGAPIRAVVRWQVAF
jgi:hypothetical protein